MRWNSSVCIGVFNSQWVLQPFCIHFIISHLELLASKQMQHVAWAKYMLILHLTLKLQVHRCHSPGKQRRRGRSRPVDGEHSHTADATGGHAGVMGGGRALWVAEREALGTGVVERGGVDVTGQSLGKQSSITTHLWTGKNITSALIHKCQMIFIMLLCSICRITGEIFHTGTRLDGFLGSSQRLSRRYKMDHLCFNMPCSPDNKINMCTKQYAVHVYLIYASCMEIFSIHCGYWPGSEAFCATQRTGQHLLLVFVSTLQ